MPFDFDIRQPAWLIANEQGALLGMSREADELLKRQPSLQQTIRDWSRTWALAQGGGASPEITLPGDDKMPPLMLEAIPMTATTPVLASAAARQLLLIRVRLLSRTDPVYLPIRPESQFTPAEQRVATLIGEGLPPREIATRLGLSVHTVRSHLKRLLSKTGVHSQAALVRALLSGTIEKPIAEFGLADRARAASQSKR
jgi:DNA-binding CsgD family transcriptional regulator